MQDQRTGSRVVSSRTLQACVQSEGLGRRVACGMGLLLLMCWLSACGELGAPAETTSPAIPATAQAVLPGSGPLARSTGVGGAVSPVPPGIPTTSFAAVSTPTSTIPAAVLATLRATPPVDPNGGPAQPFPTVSAGDFERTLQVDGKPRSYLVHVPPTDTQIDAMPFLLVLHGEGGSARAMLTATQWNVKSDKETFIVAYASGSPTGQAWSGADVPFISQLLDDVLRRDLVDPERVYVTGFGGGAQMAYRLAQMLSDRISAIAPVDATQGEQRAPSFPVALLAIHHKNDTQAPYAQAAQSVAFWAKSNGCAAAPKRETVGADAREVYTGCSAGANVFLYALNGGAHSWPAVIGSSPAVDVIWSFFAERTP